jgi:NADH-quinone oxidoreductase subunit L
VFIAFVISAMTLKSVAVDGARFNQTIYEWMVVGGLKMEIGFLVDGLTAMMMCVVTFVSLMVHIYTIGYMEEDEGYNRFFGYISLFTFSMLMLVMSNNFLQLFFGWEAVGLVSYLLIGFWYTSRRDLRQPQGLPGQPRRRLRLHPGHRPDRRLRRTRSTTARPSPTRRAGGPLRLRHRLDADHGDLHLPVHRRDGQERAVPAARVAARLDGRPTPISALIHAATMVTAGIFMVARMSPLFELSDTALSW